MANNYNFICFDIETGGFKPEQNPITEIAMIVYDVATFEEKFRFETFVKPYNDLILDPKALQVTGINREMLEDGIDKKELVDILCEIYSSFIEGNNKFKLMPILVGHNIANFDIPFLEYLFNDQGRNLYHFVNQYKEDTLWMARTKWFGKADKLNLGACCSLAGIDIIDAHRALNDVSANKMLHEYLVKSLRNDSSFTANNNNKNSFRKQFQF